MCLRTYFFLRKDPQMKMSHYPIGQPLSQTRWQMSSLLQCLCLPSLLSQPSPIYPHLLSVPCFSFFFSSSSHQLPSLCHLPSPSVLSLPLLSLIGVSFGPRGLGMVCSVGNPLSSTIGSLSTCLTGYGGTPPSEASMPTARKDTGLPPTTQRC